MEILATLSPRPSRRWVALIIQAALGALLVWLGVILPEGPVVLRVVLVAVGALALVGALRMYNATADRIELTREALTDSRGRVLARVDEITTIDRGAFAFKPSNGFLLHLAAARAPRTWIPGLWWRIGRFVGVGGVTSANEAKAMAEIIAVLVAERRQS